MRKAIAIGVVALAVAVALWFFFSGSSTDGTPSTPTVTRTPGAPPADALFNAPLQQGTGAESIRGVVFDGTTPLAGVTLVATRLDAEEDLSSLDCELPCKEKLVTCGSLVADSRVVEWVQSRRGEAPPVARATSGADGTFELTGLTPGAHRVWASAEGHGVTLAPKTTAGETKLEVTFGREVLVAGKVVDFKRAPIAGVWVTGFYANSPRYFDAQTKADGTFSLGKLPMGEGLSLVAMGGPGVSDHLHLSASSLERMSELRRIEATTLTLAPLTERVVRVLYDGHPVAGARIRKSEGAHTTDWTTDTAGEATVKVRALGRGLEPLLVSWESLAGEARLERGTAVTIVELAPAHWISGLVTDETKRPLEDVTIDGDDTSVRTDANGHYRLGPFLSRVRRAVRASMRGRVSDMKVQKREDDAVDFVLPPEAPLAGTVLDPDGKPLADATVWAEVERRGPPKTTGADGTFLLEGLAAGTVSLNVVHTLWGTLRREVTAPNTSLELRMARGAALDIHVVDERDTPLSMRVSVMADRTPLERKQGEQPRDSRSDRLGHATVQGLAGGRYVVMATEEEGRPRALQTVQLAAEGRGDVRLVCPEGLSIEGQVTDAAGKALADVNLDARPEAIAPSPPTSIRPSMVLEEMSQGTRATSDVNGHFALKHLRAGNYRITAFSRAGRVEKLAVAGTTTLVLELPTLEYAVGRVVDSQQKPLTTAVVDGEEVDAETATFRVAVEPGRKDVTVSEERYPTRTLGLPPLRGGEHDLGTVVMGTGRTVKVTVVDAKTGTPIANARVWPLGGSALRGPDDNVTDATGSTTLTGLSSDEAASLTTSAEGYLRSDGVEVPLNQNEVKLTLDRGVKLSGTIFQSDGGVATFAHLSLRDADAGFGASGGTDPEGHYTLTTAAGTWELKVDLGPGHLRLPVSTVTLNADTVLDLREPSGGVSVSFHFVDAQGEEQMVMGMLLPGVVATPESFDGYRALTRNALRITRGETAAPPGEFTLMGVLPTMGDQLYVFAERVLITQAPSQNITVRVPLKPTLLKTRP